MEKCKYSSYRLGSEDSIWVFAPSHSPRVTKSVPGMLITVRAVEGKLSSTPLPLCKPGVVPARGGRKWLRSDSTF